MRLFIAALILCLPSIAWPDNLDITSDSVTGLALKNDYRFGGATDRSGLGPAPSAGNGNSKRPPRLSLPIRLPSNEVVNRREASLGAATVYVTEGFDVGRDAFELGTFVSNRQARAGLSVTYVEGNAQIARSELFIDYAFSERFTVGLSGTIDAQIDDTQRVRQLGLNAEYATSSGTYVQGGIAGTADYVPVIGLSVGLRF